MATVPQANPCAWCVGKTGRAWPREVSSSICPACQQEQLDELVAKRATRRRFDPTYGLGVGSGEDGGPRPAA